ncbi:MAG: efflux RND transporter periplasmic adaptor subunit, partial [Bryobacterales bacterium]|nr:efflux RND transporter periplasmic adaptor subunit [Bryobacterales bacterium]
MSTTTKVILALVILAGASAGYYFMNRPVGEENASAKGGTGKGGAAAKAKMAGMAAMRTVTVETVESRLGRIKERVLLTGALKPKEQVDVTPKTAGRVVKILVNVGDLVRQNSLIAELEDDELQQQLNRAKASIAVASASLSQREAELANARLNLQRAETLLKDGLIPRQQYEQESTSLRVLEAQVQLAHAQRSQAEAELRELTIRVDQTKIYAPINGQVAARFVDMGALVGPSTPLVRVVNIATLVTNTSVAESEIGKMRVGTSATVRVDAMPNEAFVGRVARISPVLDPSTRTANAEIEIPNPGMQLRAEMFVRVEMNLESSREAVLIPREALVYRGDSSGVYTIEEGKQAFRYVETGLTQDQDVEVSGNLAAGTVVIAKGASMLREGDRIQIVSGPGAAPAGGRGSRAEGGESRPPARAVGEGRPTSSAAPAQDRTAMPK